jgi:hypothetical protein
LQRSRFWIVLANTVVEVVTCHLFCSGSKEREVCVRQRATHTRASKTAVTHVMIPGSSVSLGSTQARPLQIFETWSISTVPHPSILPWRTDSSLTDQASTAAMVTKSPVGMQLLRLDMVLAISLSGTVGVHLGVMTATSDSKTLPVRCSGIPSGSMLLQSLTQKTTILRPAQPQRLPPARYPD